MIPLGADPEEAHPFAQTRVDRGDARVETVFQFYQRGFRGEMCLSSRCSADECMMVLDDCNGFNVPAS
jgi:hypothetical protein